MESCCIDPAPSLFGDNGIDIGIKIPKGWKLSNTIFHNEYGITGMGVVYRKEGTSEGYQIAYICFESEWEKSMEWLFKEWGLED